ncbi:MAG TPA: hypothetical protein VHH90_04790 [Polyangia bacterium]|nr:hypothetical protein [Polyangia bacterium]
MAAALTLTAAFLAATPARAQPPGTGPNAAQSPAAVAAISVDGICPDERAVDRAITALIPRGVGALPESAMISIEDLGETYRVDVKADGVARARLFRDAIRDCEQRARFAAVFIVLTLLPPELAAAVQPPPLPPPPPVLPPPVLPPPAPVAPPPPPRRLRLEVGVLAEAAPAVAASASMMALGGELRAAYRLGHVAAMLGVGFEPRISFSVGGLDGRELRVPVDAGLRIQRTARAVEVAGELSVVVAPFHAEGLDTAMPSSGTRLDVGARAGGLLRFAGPRTRLAPFLGLHAVVFPWPYEIGATPAGGLGTTPVLWLGATAGLSAGD